MLTKYGSSWEVWVLSRWRKSVIYNTNGVLPSRYGSLRVVWGWEGGGVAVLRVTFWGGRGWELSSGLIPWAGEGVVHLRNHAKTPNLASLSSTIASPP